MMREIIGKNIAASGLKSIGGLLRVKVDIPENKPELRWKSLCREMSVLGMTFAAGMVLDFAFSSRTIPAMIRRNGIIKFAPQAAAIFLAEMASRKLTNYNEAVQNAFGEKPKTSELPKTDDDGDTFEKHDDAMKNRHIRFKPFSNQLFRNHSKDQDPPAVVFQSGSQYPMYWARQSQFGPTARFY
jgi:hypothetical protein